MGAFVQELVSSVFTFVVYALIFAGVYKIFQMSTELGEIKDLLRDIRRNTDHHLNPPAASEQSPPSQSPDDLLRALRDQNYPLDYASDRAKE